MPVSAMALLLRFGEQSVLNGHVMTFPPKDVDLDVAETKEAYTSEDYHSWIVHP